MASEGWYEGKSCVCGAVQGKCEPLDCRQPWAAVYRRTVRPRWYERTAGWLAALITGRW